MERSQRKKEREQAWRRNEIIPNRSLDEHLFGGVQVKYIALRTLGRVERPGQNRWRAWMLHADGVENHRTITEAAAPRDCCAIILSIEVSLKWGTPHWMTSIEGCLMEL